MAVAICSQVGLFDNRWVTAFQLPSAKVDMSQLRGKMAQVSLHTADGERFLDHCRGDNSGDMKRGLRGANSCHAGIHFAEEDKKKAPTTCYSERRLESCICFPCLFRSNLHTRTGTPVESALCYL
jgi:hypothetical protein